MLDANCDAAAAATGRAPRVLRTDRITTPWAGRWLVVVETSRSGKPDWGERRAAAR